MYECPFLFLTGSVKSVKKQGETKLLSNISQLILSDDLQSIDCFEANFILC